MPHDVEKIACSLRGSSFSTISPFLLINQLLLSKQLQHDHLGTPWASQDGAEHLPRPSLGAPGAAPGRLQSTQSTSSKQSTRPRELPRDPKVVPETQATSSGCSQAFKLQAFEPCFPPSQAVVRQCTHERLRCGLATSASCPCAPQVYSWPRRGSRSATNFNMIPFRCCIVLPMACPYP